MSVDLSRTLNAHENAIERMRGVARELMRSLPQNLWGNDARTDRLCVGTDESVAALSVSNA